MSINLHCEQVDLWQTPTKVTEDCMVPKWETPSSYWEETLSRYKSWCHKKALKRHDPLFYAVYDHHMQEISEAIEKHGKLDFYAL